ncbi:MAG: hypothetical protein ACK4PR_11780, partial [Gammaproteobacteria bacterium]
TFNEFTPAELARTFQGPKTIKIEIGHDFFAKITKEQLAQFLDALPKNIILSGYDISKLLINDKDKANLLSQREEKMPELPKHVPLDLSGRHKNKLKTAEEMRTGDHYTPNFSNNR